MLGYAKGRDYEAFCKVVKRLTLRVIQPEGELIFELPLQYYNVPNYAFVVTINKPA